MIENWLDSLSSMIGQTSWLAPLLALFAGVLTSVTPCALSNVPLVIGYVGGTGQKDTRRAFWLSLTFSAGTAVTFTVLGVVASAAGKLMGIVAAPVRKAYLFQSLPSDFLRLLFRNFSGDN